VAPHDAQRGAAETQALIAVPPAAHRANMAGVKIPLAFD
jgi:hypothetical protein